MKTMEFNEYLSAHGMRVFNLSEACRIIGKPRHYAAVFLSRDKKIKRAERGVYYTQEASEYEVASRIVFPSYISLVSALRFYDLTEQMPNIIYVLSCKRHKTIESLNGYKVKFKTIKKSLMYGYAKIDGAFVASPEKAVVDMIYLNGFVEYAEEVVEANKLNEKRLREYAAMTKKKLVVNKINSLLGLK